MPFCSNSDDAFYEILPNCQPNSKDIMVFPTLDIMYSFLKKPLDYYLGDSNGIFNLDIYKITVNDTLPKLFYKKIDTTVSILLHFLKVLLL